MVKRYELGMVEYATGDYVLHEDHAKALALIAEMKKLLAYTAPFCDMRDDYDACMALVARAEELLK